MPRWMEDEYFAEHTNHESRKKGVDIRHSPNASVEHLYAPSFPKMPYNILMCFYLLVLIIIARVMIQA